MWVLRNIPHQFLSWEVKRGPRISCFAAQTSGWAKREGGLGLKSRQLLGWGLGVAEGEEPQIREESEQGYMRSRPLRMHAPILVGQSVPELILGSNFLSSDGKGGCSQHCKVLS